MLVEDGREHCLLRGILQGVRWRTGLSGSNSKELEGEDWARSSTTEAETI